MKIGSEAHKELFCKQFEATYTEFDPETLPWPELDEAELGRLRSVPFWQEVLFTERRAGFIVKQFAETIDDPMVRHAVDMQGLEETRHANLLRTMIRRYGLPAEEPPLEPITGDPITAFKDFGFGECLDSFLGFGAFKIARQSNFMPESMFRIFEILMYEETRHIVFFINWMAWEQARRGRGWWLFRSLTSLRFYSRAIGRLIGTVRRGQDVNDGKDFSATQASVFLDDFTFRKFLTDCYAENMRRMAEIDPDLLKPSLLPKIADFALTSLRLWSFGRDARKSPA